MKKILGTALLAAGISFAQIGMEGGTDGLHQTNAKTLGQWHFAVGTGGNIAIDGWALARGGKYQQDGKNYTYRISVGYCVLMNRPELARSQISIESRSLPSSVTEPSFTV